MKSLNEKYIKRCFQLARNGGGFVSPNPLVGAVIVKNNKVISEGWHAKYGEAHAEANAIANSKEDLEGATIYCNLEPCCHTEKKTPPCVPRIIESGIKKVVISNVDPNPRVDGGGIKQLRQAGIEVSIGILEEEGSELNKFFFKHVLAGIPYVTLKVAQSLDCKISAGDGIQTWLTGEESAKFVHTQRSIYDAVLVGANTIKIDDPLLNVRYSKGRNPKKVIVDGKLSSPINSKVFNDENLGSVIVFTKKNSNSEKISQLKEKGVKIFELECLSENQLDIKEILKILGKEKINSVFVEGGGNIFSQFIGNNLFDELIVLQAPILLGNGVNSFYVMNSKNLNLKFTEKIGDDFKFVFKNDI